MDLVTSSAVVTGGASGLGEATARALAERGAHVVIVDLNDERGAQVAHEIGATYVRADVTDDAAVQDAVSAAEDAGPLRALVNCAGIAKPIRTIGRDGRFESAQPMAQFSRIVAVNLFGTYNCARLAATAMSRNDPLVDGQRGAIVNTSSIAAFDGQVGQTSYSASKAAIVGLTLPLARDLAPAGIRVNTIAPGLIDTPIYDTMPDPIEFKNALRRDVLFPDRLGTAAEFARLAVELLTNDYLNAEVVRLDGGARLRVK